MSGVPVAVVRSASFQQKIEWVRLMERHPKYFEEAKRLREERH